MLNKRSILISGVSPIDDGFDSTSAYFSLGLDVGHDDALLSVMTVINGSLSQIIYAPNIGEGLSSNLPNDDIIIELIIVIEELLVTSKH